MTMQRIFPALFALLLVAALPQPEARAQTTFELGPRVGLEIDEIESLALGADLRVSTVELPFQVQGTFDYYFVDDDDFLGTNANIFRVTANALYEVNFGDNELFTPYFGPGLSVTRISQDLPDGSDGSDGESDLGLNVVGGAEFEAANFGFGAVRPFVQADFVPLGGDIQPFQITGGILFAL